jgi:polar amino acid transport system substrate-binding protein
MRNHLIGVVALLASSFAMLGVAEAAQVSAGDPEVVALVPQSFKDRGTIRVLTDPTYPPLESINGEGGMEGLDIDLMNAIAGEMGLSVDWQTGTFDSIIPGLQADRFDAAIAGMYISNSKYDSITMIQYGQASDVVVVKPDYSGPALNKEFPDFCGVPLAVQSGSNNIDRIRSKSSKCVEDGRGEMNLLTFQNANDALLAVNSGRAVGALVGSISANFQIKEAGVDLKIGGTDPRVFYNGITVQKDSLELARAISKALETLKASGRYQAILAKWNVAGFAVDEFPINPKVPDNE